MAAGIILALLVGKGIAAGIVSGAFNYPLATRMTVWALTLPIVQGSCHSAKTAGIRPPAREQ